MTMSTPRILLFISSILEWIVVCNSLITTTTRTTNPIIRIPRTTRTTFITPQSRLNRTRQNVYSFNLNNDWNTNKNNDDNDDDDNNDVNNDENNQKNNLEKDIENSDSSKLLPTWAKALAGYEPLSSTTQKSIPNFSRVSKNFLRDDHEDFLTRQKQGTVNGNSSGNSGNEDSESESDVSSDRKEKEKKRFQMNIPLASLINVEALLLASGPEDDNMTLQQQGQKQLNDKDSTTHDDDDTNKQMSDITPKLDELGDWDNFVQTLQQNIKDLVEYPGAATTTTSSSSTTTTTTPSDTNTITSTSTTTTTNKATTTTPPIATSAELILKEATQKIENFLNETTTSFSPDKVQEMIASTSLSLALNQKNTDVFKTTMNSVVATAEAMAKEQGLDVSDAAEQARATTKYTTEFLHMSNGLLLSGYVSNSNGYGSLQNDKNRVLSNEQIAKQMNIPLSKNNDDDSGSSGSVGGSSRGSNTKPLYHNFETAKSIPDSDVISTIDRGSIMAQLAGAIYQNTIPIVHDLGHSLVANGTAADVAWMITDSVGYEEDYMDGGIRTDPILIRTIIIRGYDASDESVDRELLLNQILTANPVPISSERDDVMVHSGLLDVAKEIYKQILPFVDMTGPKHKIALTGHSIGGSLSLLVLFLLAEERGNIFIQENILRAYTFGSPPIAFSKEAFSPDDDDKEDCTILGTLGLPTDIVYGYAQPWDPIIRLFSTIDALYPLVGDLGEDGVSLYASGPNRALRPIVRTILEAWEGWPSLRENCQLTMDQDYKSVGVQHILLPDPGRYLTDRLLSVNIGAPPTEELIRISSYELYPALEETFPLDTFSISFVPVAIRSFIHHFFPAYDAPLEAYARQELARREKNKESQSSASSSTKEAEKVMEEVEGGVNEDGSSIDNNEIEDLVMIDIEKVKKKTSTRSFDWAGEATKWVLGE